MPSIDQLFNPITAPGLGQSVNFIRLMAFFDVDYRQPKNARRRLVSHGLLALRRSQIGRFSVNRLDTDLRQFFDSSPAAA